MAAEEVNGQSPPPHLRVLLLAPSGRDGDILAQELRRRDYSAFVCRRAAELSEQISAGAGALLVAEEALAGSEGERILAILEQQPPWSELPLILMTLEGSSPASARWRKILDAAGNVTFLERPLRLMTLFSVLGSALRSRARQYQVRDLLAQERRGISQRDKFLAMLGHELRNPLSAMVNAVGILQRFGLEDGALTREQLDVLARQSFNMSRLVDDLLDVARITSGKVTLNPRLLDLREVVNESLRALKLSMGSRLHQIQLETALEPVMVHGDPVRLEQVIGNLITNAVKYTPEDGSIFVSVNGGDEAIVRVRDTGEGIPPEMLEEIFQPFTQTTQSLARSRGGLGLGLVVVRNLVEMHCGRIVAKSDGLGHGSEFTLYLPIARSTAPLTSNRSLAPEKAFAGDGRDVLVIEDNTDSRRGLARLLTLFGHRVQTAVDGVVGLQKALVEKPEIVLLDIGLPEMDGYEVAQRLREAHGRAIYLVALTGYGQPDDQERARQAGFDLHLIKPVQPDQLAKVISGRPAEAAVCS